MFAVIRVRMPTTEKQRGFSYSARQMMAFGGTAFLFVCILSIAPRASTAHDYWLQPAKFVLAKGESTDVRLFVGDHFASEVERPFQPKMTVKLQLFSSDKSADLKGDGVKDRKPFITMKPANPGGHLVALERDWSLIELKAEKFNDYLEHEGLSDILEVRRKAGELNSDAKERYRRYLKALVHVGDRQDAAFSRRIGHRLEIIPATNPSKAGKDDKLAVKVLFDGKPLKNAQVSAYHRSADKVAAQESRTDAQGNVRFTVDASGLWLIRLVHMQRCKADPKIDWESFWCAYTFERR